MDPYEQLINEFNLIKKRIEALKETSVGKHQETVKLIQLEYLNSLLLEVSRKIRYYNMYRKDR